MIQFCTPNQKNKIKQLLIKNINNDKLKTKESLEQMIINVANIPNFKFEHVADDKDIVRFLKSMLPGIDLSNKDGSIIPYSNIIQEVKSYSINDLFHRIPSAKNEFDGYSTRMFLGHGILGVNKNSEYSLDNKSLNENFAKLKSELFEKIQKFLINKGYYTGNVIPLFDTKGIINYKAYSNIMKLLSGYFYNPGNFNIIRSPEGRPIPDLSMKLNENREVFEAYYNMIILSNFDSIIATKFKSFFKVNINKFNQINSTFADADKYSLSFDAKTTAYWAKDSHEAESSEGRIDDFTKDLITLIPRYNKQGGKTSEYMEVNDLYLIAAVISEFELKHGNKFRNNPRGSNGFNYFNTNGVERLKWYLKEIQSSMNKEPGSLSELSSSFGIIYDKILSIDKFINHSEYNIAEKEANSNNSIMSFISQVINNNYGANYSVYTHNGEYKVQEMYNQDFNSTRVQSTLYSTMKMNFANPSFYDLKNDKELNLFNSLFPKNVDTIENFYTAVERNEINHDKLNKYIKSKTGISMTKSSLLSAIFDIESYDNKTVTGTSFKNALYNLINAINDDFKSNEFKNEVNNSVNDGRVGLDSTIGSFLTNSKKEQLFIALKNAFAEKFSIRAVMNVKTADGNALPTFKVSNLTYKDTELFEQQREYENSNSGNLHKSLLILDQNAIEGTITKLEVLGKKRSKAFDKLSVQELFQSDFQYDFIENIVQNNKFSVIIGNYSDKSTILAKLVNGDFSINNGKNILEESVETILEKVRTQGYNYYHDSLTKVVSDYKYLMDLVGYKNDVNTDVTSDLNNSISQIEKFLANNKITDLVKIIADEQLRLGKSTGVELIEELHYSKYSNGVTMNSLLLDNFRIYSSPKLFNQFVNFTEKSALSKITNNNFKISNTESVLTKFNLKKSDFTDITSEGKETNSYTKIVFENGNLNPLFRKWMWLNSLFRNEYLYISTKGEYMHPHKIRNNFNSRSGDFNEKGYWNNYFLDMSKRLSSMAKRNVTNTASIEVPVRKSSKGISENVILASIEDLQDNIYTTSGHMKHGNRSQDVHDGASYIDAVYSRMLDESFPGKGYSGTKKQFGTLVTPHGVTIKKDAESVITNTRIRSSLNSSVSLLNMKKRMLSIPINETINYISKDLQDYYVYQGGRRQQLKKLLLDTKPSGEIIATITYSEGNWNAIQKRFVYAKDGTRTITINNLYDLWTAIGGYHTIDADGNFNERSNDFLYEIITEVKGVDSNGNETDERILKEKMIHILSNKSALKAGATNLNSKDAWKDGNINLAYSIYKSRFMGPQLDASHDADDSDIREVSQVISAVSQGGYTSELADEIYSDIAAVIKESVKKYSMYLDNGKVKDKEKLYRILSNKFVDAIQKSDRDEITKSLIDSLKANGIDIPISSQHFYNLFIRDVVTTLNNEFITRRYPGLGGVLIPSQGIIQIYDVVTKSGEQITATQEDLLKDALDQYSKGRKTKESLTNDEIFNNYITNNLTNIKRFVGEIELGDRVIANGQEYDLSDIVEYYKFKETYHPSDVVEKIIGVPRDLKPTLHKFKTYITSPDTGQEFLITKNLFDLQPLKLLYKRSIEKSDNINILTESEAELLAYIESFSDNVDGFLRAWLQRNYELLDHNLTMPEITIENIESIFGKDDLLNDVLADVLPMYSEIGSEIFDLKFQPAEIIMGDIYKTNFARDDNTSMYDIYKQEHLYFKNKLLNLYNTDDSTEADLKILTEDSSNPLYIKFVVEFSQDSNVNLKINPDSHEGIKSRYDEMGNKLYDVVNRFTINPYLNSNGKEIIEVKITNDQKETQKTINKLISSVKGMRSVTPLNYDNSLLTKSRKNKKNNAILQMLTKKIDYLMSLYSLNDLKASTFEYFTDENLNNYDLSSSNWFDQNKDEILENIAKKMYISWKHSHNKVASRIPAQSMQSFMPMRNAAYIMDGSNDVYVNVHQIFLQGSDFDVDKAYILGNGFSTLGKIDLWTNISNYDSQETLNALLELPIPTGKTINIEIGNASESDPILEEMYQSFAISLGDIGLTRNLSSDSLKILNKIIRYINNVVKHNPDELLFLFENELVNLPIEDFKNLINKHNTYVNYRRGNNSLKNSVTHKINKVISTPSNQLNANIPVDVDILHDAAERSEIKRGVQSNDTNLNSSDMLSYYQQQYNASVGKDDVGIFANGMKGLLALTSYYNNYYKHILNNQEELHKIRQSNKTFNKLYEWQDNSGEIKTFRLGSISDIQISKTQEKRLKEILGDDYKKLNRNAIIIMSSLISAATDNAKELIMAKINASVELASMHAYMVTMGFHLDDIVDFMTSDAAQLIINNSQDNIYNDDYPKSILKEIAKLKKQKHSPEIASQLRAFEQIYKDSKEFSALTGLLGINQKRKADTWEMFNYLNRFTKLMNDGKSIYKLSKDSKSSTNEESRDKKIGNNSKYVDKANFVTITFENNTVLDISNELDVLYVESIYDEITNVKLADGKTANMLEFFDINHYLHNKNYQEAAKKLYNLVKRTFNVFDIIEEVPHFAEMINSLKISHSMIRDLSSAYNFTMNYLVTVLNEEANKFSGDSIHVSKKNLLRGTNYFNHMVTRNWLKTERMGKYVFNVSDLLKLTNTKSITLYTSNNAMNTKSDVLEVNKDDNFIISLDTDYGIANFKKVMEELLLPYLQTLDRSDALQNLRVETVNNSFGLKTNAIISAYSISSLNTSVGIHQFDEILKAFNNLDTNYNTKNRIKNSLFENLKWRDLFYIYNLIVNDNKVGDKRLTSLFRDYNNESDSLSISHAEYFNFVDSSLENFLKSDLTNDPNYELAENKTELEEKYEQNMINTLLFYAFQEKGVLSDISDIKVNNVTNPDFVIISNIMNNSDDSFAKLKKILNKVDLGGFLIEYKC